MERGGKRAGAGRKKGYAAISAEEARKVFAQMVMDEIIPISKALIKKAKAGDVSAAREVLDRAFGKPAPIDPKQELFRSIQAGVERARKRYRTAE